jgi:hypothetical protein
MKKLPVLLLILSLALTVSSCRRVSATADGTPSSSEEPSPAVTVPETDDRAAAASETTPASGVLRPSAEASVVPSADMPGIPQNAVWAGEWKRMKTGRFNSATLVILNETTTGFDFQIDAFSGANMGFANGTATVAGNSAHYEDSETGAELSFNISSNTMELTANDAANEQNGMGVCFDGFYSKGALPEDTLLSLGFVATQAQEDAFKAMVGDDYELFLNTANICTDKDDLDGLGAVVTMWWVHGFGDYYESMLMVMPDGGLCAGVIDNDNTVIKVFTDDSEITSVPKTIQAWISGFDEMRIEFHNTAKN